MCSCRLDKIMKTQRYVKLTWDRCLVLLFHYQQDLRCTDVMFNVVWSRGITMRTGALPFRVHVHVLSQPLLVLDVSLGVVGRNSISSSNTNVSSSTSLTHPFNPFYLKICSENL